MAHQQTLHGRRYSLCPQCPVSVSMLEVYELSTILWKSSKHENAWSSTDLSSIVSACACIAKKSHAICCIGTMTRKDKHSNRVLLKPSFYCFYTSSFSFTVNVHRSLFSFNKRLA